MEVAHLNIVPSLWLVFKAVFQPPSDEITNPAEYFVGKWLYNTVSGESRLLNRNAYNKTISDRVSIGGEDDATISGDGNIVWYLETDGISLINESAPSMLKRLDLVSGQTTTVDIEGPMSALSSSDDGSRLLFKVDDRIVE